MKNSHLVLIGLILYLVSTSAAYAYFNRSVSPSGSSQPVPGSEVTIEKDTLIAINPSEPRTETCPLNGALYTKAEREAWEKRRPLVIMVENSPDARPHSGINRADIVYEAVAEGGVTRFMPVYYCDAQRSVVTVAPVRSVRMYFIDWASEYGATPLFGHVGGANCSADKLPNGNFGPCKTDSRVQAIEQLGKIGWRYAMGNDLDQFSVGAKAYIRNESRLGHPVATEHSVEASTEKLWKVGADRGWTNLDPEGDAWTDAYKAWKFKDEAAETERGSITTISHDFWQGYKQFDVRWDYDRASNQYKRNTGGEIHKDLETGEQLTTKNVVIQFAKEIGPVDDLKHMLYTTTGEGETLIFQDGQVIKGYWKKANRLGRTTFYTQKGQEIAFNPGRIWIAIVPTGTNVAYEPVTP